MDLYRIDVPGWAPMFEGTQAAAKARARNTGGSWAAAVVPDRKEERLAWLNSFSAQVRNAAYAEGRGAKMMPVAAAAETEEIWREVMPDAPQAPPAHETGVPHHLRHQTRRERDAPPVGPVPPAMRKGGAIARLATFDEPRTDEICEIISQSNGYALARFASCVAVQFNALAKKD